MKQIAISILFATLFSCTKSTKCVPVTPPQPTRINNGCWLSSYGSVCFTDSLLSKDLQPFYPYAITEDSIYLVFDDGSKFAQYGYTLANDTLRLYPTLHHPDAPFTYWR